MATSPGVSMSGEKPHSDGQVNSPTRINPPKPRQNAAHNITLSNVTGSDDHLRKILVSSSGVIGKRVCLCPAGRSLWMPWSAYVKQGREDRAGSGYPLTIWRCRTALK